MHRLKLTEPDLARRAGVDRSRIYNILTGRQHLLSTHDTVRVAEALGVTPRDITELLDEAHNPVRGPGPGEVA